MKKNCKGFVLLETLIVAVFIVGIFTFLYSSVIPLLGTYEDLTNKASIDVVYKLYHLRSLLKEDSNLNTFTNNTSGEIECINLNNKNKCEELVGENYLDLGNEFVVVYTKDIKNSTYKEKLKDIDAVMNNEVLLKYLDGDILNKYIDNNEEASTLPIILLYDEKNDAVAHLAFAVK